MDIIIPDQLRELSQKRCDRWHDAETDDWTLGDWGNALAGEVGELCNVVKKVRRHQAGASQAYNTPDLVKLKLSAAEECADVLLYLDLLMWKAGLTEGELLVALREKFNLVSRAQGWDDLVWDA